MKKPTLKSLEKTILAKIITTNMKSKLTKSMISLAVIALSFGVTACSVDPTSRNSDYSAIGGSSEQEIHYMNVSLRNWYDERPQTDYILGFAHLWYEGETLGTAFKDVIQPRVLVAGDVFRFSYTGELADPVMSIPGVLSIYGELIDYEYIKTTIEKVEPEDVSLADALSMYEINDPYVILNQQGAYTSLEKFEGDKVFVTLDYKKMYIDVKRTDDPVEPSRPIAAAIYAFDPRNS